jgi:ATP-dependent Clp protease adaptor protein ClpS
LSQTSTVSKTQEGIRLPALWHVILHNDDFTPFDFVIELLMVVFNKSPDEATEIAGFVHTKGRAKVGLYTREVAESKVSLSMSIAADESHPLLITTERA